MIKCVVILILILAFASIADVRTVATLAWDYPASEVPTMTFNLYASTNLNVPSWTILTNVAGTNLIATNPSVSVPILPGNQFFFCTASNEFGESLPSNTVTATVARAIQTLKIK